MGTSVGKRIQGREKRHKSIRKKIRGSAGRPRLSIYKSLNNFWLQLIDDDKGLTLASASTLDKDFKDQLKTGSNKVAAKKVAEILADKALEKNIKTIVFDRSGYLYHGCIKVIADALREKGFVF